MSCFHLLLFLAAVWGAWAQLNPLMLLKQGNVSGETRLSADGRSYIAFEGIPYAQAPIGKRRFKEPEDPKPWTGIWDATKPGSECLQYTHKFTDHDPVVTGDENCLFINVYIPKIPEDTSPLLDVIVYIHGGAFMFGVSHIYGPRYLMDRDVVFVTFNYRVGILGFLSTEDEVVPGNNGLKDQTMALKWIQNNIASFGGNPNSVTITGTSAGGASVHYHYLSPLSRGLFKQGLSASGTALAPWPLTEKPREKANKLGELMGCSPVDSKELVRCLKQRPAHKLVELTEVFMPFHYNPFTPFGPVVEKAGAAPFISKSPIEIINCGSAHDLPIIFSVASEEGLYPVAEFLKSDEILQDLDSRFTEIAPLLLDYNDTVEPHLLKSVSNRIREFYFGDKRISRDTAKELIKMVGDRMYYIGVEKAARLHAAVAKSPVYFYMFAYRGKHSLSEFLSGYETDYGVSHGDDSAYTLDAFYLKADETKEDRDMVQTMLHVWTTFARTGTPTFPSGVTWEPVVSEAEDLRYLRVINSSNQQMESSPDLGNRKFWESLPISEPQVLHRKTQDEL